MSPAVVLSLLFACLSSAPEPAAPKPSAPREVADLPIERLIGLAARSDDDACALLTRVLALDGTAAPEDGAPPGTRLVDGALRADWTELAVAVGEGSLAVDLVTIGALEALRDEPCLQPRVVERWTRRDRAFDQAPACAQPLLLPRYLSALSALRDPCVCEPVDPIHAERIARRMQPRDAALAERFRAWPEQAVPCAPAVAPPPPQP